MKKSVIAFISAIYLLSIFAVGILGMKSKVYNEKVYVNEIEVINEDVIKREDGTYYLKINVDDGPIIIDRKIYPVDATTKETEYVYDDNKTYVSINKKGVVTFSRPGLITVYITAKDGSGVQTELVIRAV